MKEDFWLSEFDHFPELQLLSECYSRSCFCCHFSLLGRGTQNRNPFVMPHCAGDSMDADDMTTVADIPPFILLRKAFKALQPRNFFSQFLLQTSLFTSIAGHERLRLDASPRQQTAGALSAPAAQLHLQFSRCCSGKMSSLSSKISQQSMSCFLLWLLLCACDDDDNVCFAKQMHIITIEMTSLPLLMTTTATSNVTR